VEKKKQFLVTQQPEWKERMDRLKQRRFYNQSKAAMIRYLINKGLDAAEREQAEKKD
jgi:hypothetical protein